MRIRPIHFTYWTPHRRAVLESSGPIALAPRACDPIRTIESLEEEPLPPLTWLARALAFLTTPFKRLGISGWTDTGCWAVASGIPVRDAQHSTDGFWTIDVKLTSFAILDRQAASERYVRLEIEPGTEAHRIARARRITPGDHLDFAGPVLVDEDGPFLEVHPARDFRVRPRSIPVPPLRVGFSTTELPRGGKPDPHARRPRHSTPL